MQGESNGDDQKKHAEGDPRHNADAQVADPEEKSTHREQPRHDIDNSRRVLSLSFEALSLIFDGIIAIAAVVGSVFVYRQLAAVEDQLAVMRDQLTDARTAAKQADKTTDRQLGIAESQAGSLSKLANASELASKNTAKAVGVAAMQLERTDRPFMNVTLMTTEPVTPTEYGLVFPIQIVVTNVGRSPGYNVQIWGSIATYGYPAGEVTGAIAEQCRKAELYLKDTSGVTIAPSQTATMQLRGNTVSAENARAHVVHHGSDESFYPIIVGCVAYNIPYSTRIHHTRFARMVFRREENVPFWQGWGYHLGQTVAATDVVISQLPTVKEEFD